MTHTHTSLFRQTQRGGNATVVCEASEIREHDEALVFRDIIPFLSHRFLCSPHNRHFGRKPNGHRQLLWWLKRPGQLALRWKRSIGSTTASPLLHKYKLSEIYIHGQGLGGLGVEASLSAVLCYLVTYRAHAIDFDDASLSGSKRKNYISNKITDSIKADIMIGAQSMQPCNMDRWMNDGCQGRERAPGLA